MGTNSLEKSYPGYDFSRDIVPKVQILNREISYLDNKILTQYYIV